LPQIVDYPCARHQQLGSKGVGLVFQDTAAGDKLAQKYQMSKLMREVHARAVSVPFGHTSDH
jgi:hypothetical protein